MRSLAQVVDGAEHLYAERLLRERYGVPLAEIGPDDRGKIVDAVDDARCEVEALGDEVSPHVLLADLPGALLAVLGGAIWTCAEGGDEDDAVQGRGAETRSWPRSSRRRATRSP